VTNADGLPTILDRGIEVELPALRRGKKGRGKATLLNCSLLGMGSQRLRSDRDHSTVPIRGEKREEEEKGRVSFFHKKRRDRRRGR